MNDIEKILGEMEAYVETHAKGWGSKDSAQDYQSKHALCWSATQHIPRLIAAVRVLLNGIETIGLLGVPKGSPADVNFAVEVFQDAESALTGNSETTGTESNDAN
jgi:hypothetical protein